MIPTINILTQEITDTNRPSRTYSISVASGRATGYIDDLEAVKQSVYLILSSERYKHIIYSWDYGIELVDLVGKPMPYIMSELPRRIRDALRQDDRVVDVTDFNFEKNKRNLNVTFTVITKLGNLSTELEVEV